MQRQRLRGAVSALVFMREARGDDAGLVPQGVTHALSHNLYYVALPDMRLTCARRCPHVHPEGTPPHGWRRP